MRVRESHTFSFIRLLDKSCYLPLLIIDDLHVPYLIITIFVVNKSVAFLVNFSTFLHLCETYATSNSLSHAYNLSLLSRMFPQN